MWVLSVEGSTVSVEASCIAQFHCWLNLLMRKQLPHLWTRGLDVQVSRCTGLGSSSRAGGVPGLVLEILKVVATYNIT